MDHLKILFTILVSVATFVLICSVGMYLAKWTISFIGTHPVIFILLALILLIYFLKQ